MKAILISIRPEWVKKICNKIGEKDGKPIFEKPIEARKSAPKETPFKAYIYCTKGKDGYEWLYRVDNNGYGKAQSWHGKVIGEFICDKVYSIKNQGNSFVVANEEQGVTNEIARQSCLDYNDMVGYLGNKDGYGLHITALKIYDKPKELSEFSKPCPIDTRNCENCITYGKPYTWDFGEKTEKIFCTRRLTRPPQSWCYVEEL